MIGQSRSLNRPSPLASRSESVNKLTKYVSREISPITLKPCDTVPSGLMPFPQAPPSDVSMYQIPEANAPFVAPGIQKKVNLRPVSGSGSGDCSETRPVTVTSAPHSPVSTVTEADVAVTVSFATNEHGHSNGGLSRTRSHHGPKDPSCMKMTISSQYDVTITPAIESTSQPRLSPMIPHSAVTRFVFTESPPRQAGGIASHADASTTISVPNGLPSSQSHVMTDAADAEIASDRRQRQHSPFWLISTEICACVGKHRIDRRKSTKKPNDPSE